MPVQKFRTFDEAADALIRPATDDDATLPSRIAALWERASALSAPLGMKGVRKFRTIEASNAHRDELTVARPRTPAPTRDD